MASNTEIANLAISHLGHGKEIADLDTENSAAANACRRYYEKARDMTLRDFAWPFATKFAELALVEEDPTDEWAFSYQVPSDCLMVRKILSGVRTDYRESRVPYRIVGTKIYTDTEDAQVEYTERVTDEALYPFDFMMAFSWRLSFYVAARITAGDPFKLRESSMQMYRIEISTAQANSFNEEQPDITPDSEFIRNGMTIARQLSFAGGEFSPSVNARVDQDKYAIGLRTLLNFLVMRHGGATNRPGTSFIGEVKDSSKAVRLIPFDNGTNRYVLEFGNLYIRVIKDQAYVYDLTLTITNITKANPAVLTYTGTDPSNGDHVDVSGVIGMTQVNNRRFKVANVNGGANTFELQTVAGVNVNSTSYTTYSSSGSAKRVLTVTTTYVEADLPLLKYIQSANIMTLTHTGYAPRELTRSSDTSWTLSTISFVPSISTPTNFAVSGTPGTEAKYKITAVKDETFEESLPASSVGINSQPTVDAPRTLTWNAVSGAREYNIYRGTFDNDIFGFVDIAGDTSYKDIGVPNDTLQTPPDTRNPFSSSGDWPATSAYIQQRRMFASTTNNPEKIWGSRIGFFTNFTISTPIQDDDAVTFTMNGRKVNAVKHLLDVGRKLVIFTTSGEYVAEGNAAGVITPAEISPKQLSYNGASDLVPLVANSTALYVQASGSIVRDLNFDIQSSAPGTGIDLTIFSSHLFDDYTLDDWAYQITPHSIVWIARSDGTMLGMTYVKEQQLVAWHRHYLGGDVENTCVLKEGNDEFLYVVVNRTINSSTFRYVERMNTRKIVDDVVEDMIFMDSALTYDGRNTTSVTMTISGGTNYTYDEELISQPAARRLRLLTLVMV
jgi:hypothetical protein